MEMQDEFEKGRCRRIGWLSFVVRDSCSAGRSAGLNSFASSFSQTKAGMYYCNWRLKREVFLSKSGSLAGAVTGAPVVLSEFSSGILDVVSLRPIIIASVCLCVCSL